MHHNLPTLNELLNVWAVAGEEAPQESADEAVKEEYQRKIAVLTWYLDVWVPMVCLPLWFGPTIRPYKLMTDMTTVEGKQKVFVTVTSEAYGLIQFENSRNKWIEIFKWKKINGSRKKAPQYSKNKHEETKQFKAKWSESKNGQCSGWDTVAYSTFNQRKDHIRKFREEDAADDYKRMKFGQSLIKAAREIAQNVTEHTNKRRRTANGDTNNGGGDAVMPIITIEDE